MKEQIKGHAGRPRTGGAKTAPYCLSIRKQLKQQYNALNKAQKKEVNKMTKQAVSEILTIFIFENGKI